MGGARGPSGHDLVMNRYEIRDVGNLVPLHTPILMAGLDQIARERQERLFAEVRDEGAARTAQKRRGKDA